MDFRKAEVREWWLLGFAVAVILVLTCGILSMTFTAVISSGDSLYSQTLKEWVRALAALVLLFDLYTAYQHFQLQGVRRRLIQREQIFHLITESAADMIVLMDRDGVIQYASSSYERTLGYSPAELSHSLIDQVHPDDQARFLAALARASDLGHDGCTEHRIRHSDGSWRVLESTPSTVADFNGDKRGLVLVSRDITERKHAEALLEHRALHDSLTNLPNRALFLDRLQRSIAVSRRHRDFKFAVLFVDIDGFKVFNDSLGYAAGDELLIQISHRLTSCLRSGDTVAKGKEENLEIPSETDTLARPGGDEFAVLAAELRSPSDAVRIAERIGQRLAVPFGVSGRELVITASVGIVFGSQNTGTAEEVLRDAEIAMYRAKRAGRSCSEVFDSAMQVDIVKRMQLETDLRRALELREFRIHYQPLVSIQSSRIIGFEALSRWERPHGLVPPSEFIDVADETGIILPMNRALLEEACERLRKWHDLLPSDPPLAMSVNVTAKQFSQPDLAYQIRQTLRKTGIDPGCIELEISEKIAMSDAERSSEVLSDLKQMGVQLSIDDFGTGYSSLSRLQSFPVDTLKIDRAFISRMDVDQGTHEIVRTIILLAHNFGLKVIAEGIENQKQLEMLANLGCELGQGYYFSKPVDASAIETVLVQQGNRCQGVVAVPPLKRGPCNHGEVLPLS